MIFTGFKRKSNQIFLNKRISEFLKKSASISSKEIKQIFVILDSNSNQDKIEKELKGILNISKNNIEFVVFQQKGTKDQIVDELISPKDFGWYGRIKSDKIKSVLTKKYDLLINYSKVDNLYSNLLILQCKAAFRVGFEHLDNRFYDLLINCDSDDFYSFNKELKKYLTILNKL